MIKPQTISEQMLYSTVRIEASNGATGTGFFFHFSFPGNKIVPVIVTNKHVINNNKKEKVKFFVHTKNGSAPANKNISIVFETDWYFHPSQDLCFCFIAPFLQELKTQKNEEAFYFPVTEDLIWSDKKLEELSAIEDIVMVGYPNGLWDQKNNLPLFRRGITASHPATDFNNKNIGAVDMACFPGSSGSPIFIFNENGYSDKKGTLYLGARRLIFLGILFQGPQFNAKGELVIEDIPTQQKVSAITPMMINLGYYIKGEEILTFKPEISQSVFQK